MTRELEYDFVLQPGANPQAIRLGIEGARRLRLEHCDLVLTSAVGDVHLRSPHVYQEANGVRQEVRGHYVIASRNEVGFRVAAYDRRRALVIDPVLAYATYLGEAAETMVSASLWTQRAMPTSLGGWFTRLSNEECHPAQLWRRGCLCVCDQVQC